MPKSEGTIRRIGLRRSDPSRIGFTAAAVTTEELVMKYLRKEIPHG